MTQHQNNNFPKRPILTVIFIMAAANSVGALAMIFFMLYIAPVPQGETALVQPSDQLVTYIIGGQLVLIAIANILVRFSNRYTSKWYRQLQSGASPEHLPEAARREVLDFPMRMAGISFCVWLLAGFLFGLGITHSLLAFTGSTLVGGGFSAVLTYFGVELFWRRIIHIFFPDGKMRGTRAFRFPVFARILTVFVLISIYPVALLITLSLDRAQAIVIAPNPQAVLHNLFLIEIFLLGITLVANFGMAYFLSRTLSEPLNQLEQAMSRVENNQLDVQVLVYSNDEIGYVSERFNTMVQGLRQAERLRVLFNLYVSPEVAREALEHGAALGGQLVECAVLFADIRGFTALSEQLPPEHLIQLLNRYMSTMVAAITTYKGLVNKFGGDSLLAVFGTPLNPNPAYAQSALQAAQAMRRALERFNQIQAQDGEPELKIGIGIASGPLVAGNIGGEVRIEYTVIGDTVNLASRLQTMTKELDVDLLIDENTARQITAQDNLCLLALPELSVRGKQDPVQVYTLAGD